MVNLLVYGQLFSALNCPIALLLDLRWNPPPPTFDVAKKTNFLGLTSEVLLFLQEISAKD